MFASQLVYSLFSYLYIISETHFVTSSHMDPVSAIWIPIGMAWLVTLLKRSKFALFWILSFGVMWLLAGASHGRLFPPNTRMFMLLPWWCSFTAFGIIWLADWIKQKTGSPKFYKAFLVCLLILISATNLIQAYWLSSRRYTGTQSLEILFLRLSQKVDHDPAGEKPFYLFVTNDKWGIDGIRLIQNLYHSPQTTVQLGRMIMPGDALYTGQRIIIHSENTIVIPQPWMALKDLEALSQVMAEAGKTACNIQTAPKSPIVFIAYFPSKLAYLCPAGGNWED